MNPPSQPSLFQAAQSYQTILKKIGTGSKVCATLANHMIQQNYTDLPTNITCRMPMLAVLIRRWQSYFTAGARKVYNQIRLHSDQCSILNAEKSVGVGVESACQTIKNNISGGREVCYLPDAMREFHVFYYSVRACEAEHSCINAQLISAQPD